MSVTQTVEIPDNHKLTIDVPKEVPTGPVVITFTPACVSAKKEQTAGFNRKPIPQHFGIISPNTYSDGVAYQRKLRDEWDD